MFRLSPKNTLSALSRAGGSSEGAWAGGRFVWKPTRNQENWEKIQKHPRQISKTNIMDSEPAFKNIQDRYYGFAHENKSFSSKSMLNNRLQCHSGDLRPLGNPEILKIRILHDFKNSTLLIFKIFKKWVVFKRILKIYPRRRRRRRPRALPRPGRGIF